MTAKVTKSTMQQIYNVLIPPGILSKLTPSTHWVSSNFALTAQLLVGDSHMNSTMDLDNFRANIPRLFQLLFSNITVLTVIHPSKTPQCRHIVKNGKLCSFEVTRYFAINQEVSKLYQAAWRKFANGTHLKKASVANPDSNNTFPFCFDSW